MNRKSQRRKHIINKRSLTRCILMSVICWVLTVYITMIGLCSEKNHQFIWCRSHEERTVDKRGTKAPKKWLMDKFVPKKQNVGQMVANYDKRTIPPIIHFIFGLGRVIGISNDITHHIRKKIHILHA